MDLTGLGKNITKGFKQYKYAVLILLLGLALMLIPGKRSVPQTAEPIAAQESQSTDVCALLEEILSQIQGAGKVRVLLSEAAGERTIYQTDSDVSGDSNRQDTVIVTDGDRAQSGLIQQIDPPTYLGAIIVCQGGDRPEVRLAIAEAVSRYTGLGVDKISVLKMK